MVTSTSRPFAAMLSMLPPCVMMSTPSKRTCMPEAKPVPKICTPCKGCVEVRVPCGTRAFGIPPITPGPGVGLGTITSEIWVGLGALVVEGPRLTISIWPGVGAGGLLVVNAGPDSSTKAWLVAGSTARPPQSVRQEDVPQSPVVFELTPFITGKEAALGPNPLTMAYLVRPTGSETETSPSFGL